MWSARFARPISGGWRSVAVSGALSSAPCAASSAYPIPDAEQLDAYYATTFKSGNYEPDKAAEQLPTLRGIIDQMSRYGGARRRFDIGCFDGGLMDLAAERGWEPWGLEIQGAAAAIATERHPGHVTIGSLENAQLPPGRFDALPRSD
jgi:hypothetical protein